MQTRSRTFHVDYNTYQLYSLGDIPTEAAGSMSALAPLFSHQCPSETSTWVELDSQTATQPSDSNSSMRMVGTAA